MAKCIGFHKGVESNACVQSPIFNFMFLVFVGYLNFCNLG